MLHIMNAASLVEAKKAELELRARAARPALEFARLQRAERAARREQS